jgi:hypothetical protein
MSNLLETDYQKLQQGFLSREIIAEAKVRRVDDIEGAELVGRRANASQNYAGLIFPYYLPADYQNPREFRLRRDTPDLEQSTSGEIKEKSKYLSTPGARNMLYFPPCVSSEWLADASLPIVITEGEKKTLALCRLATEKLIAGDKWRFLPIGISGVWNWRGTIGKAANGNGERQSVKGVIPDFHLIEWKSRKVYIIFDSNVETNEQVKIARNSLTKTLKELGAKVVQIDLPQQSGINGIDDLLGFWERADGTEKAIEKGLQLLEKPLNETDADETKLRTFPIPNQNCFYGLAGDFVRLVEPHTEASRMALLAQFLVYFGNIIGRSAHYKVEGDRHFTNLFCVLIGKTAQGRKGTSFGRVKEVFRDLDGHHQAECLTSGLASGEGLLWHIRDAVLSEKKDKTTGRTETIITDPGVADKRLLVVEGEFAQVLRVQGREGNTLSAFIRNLWDTGTARSLTKNAPLKTTDAHVSIIGHITQTELLSTLTEIESANGYANRFLFFAVEREKFLPFGSEVPSGELGRLQDRISAAIEYAREEGQMSFSIEASRIWAANYERLETSRFGFLAKVTQRASPYVLRLSLIYALLDRSSRIEKQHLEAALSVWQYAEDSARYIFGERLGDPAAEKVLSALKTNLEKGLTRTEIRDLFDRHIEKSKLDSALQFLLENGLAAPRKVETGGRSKEVWFACVISDKSVISVETDSSEIPFNAYNAKSANEKQDSDKCSNCGLILEISQDRKTKYCPFGCGSQNI